MPIYSYDLLSNVDSNYKSRWEGCVWEYIPESLITTEIANDYIYFQLTELEKENAVILPLVFMKKYIHYDYSILIKTSNYLLNHPCQINNFLESFNTKVNGEQIVYNCFLNNLNLLQKLYFACKDPLFDYEGKLFWLLYSNDSDSMWKQFIDKLKDNNRIESNESHIFNNIWSDSSYSIRVEYAFDTLIKSSCYIISDKITMIFENKKSNEFDDIKKKWILMKLEKEAGNMEIINCLIGIVNKVFPLWETELITFYLTIDCSVDNFKSIYFFQLSESWSGSEIPLIDKKIEYLKELNETINGIEYLEHKAYLESEIASLIKYKSEVEIREYIEDEYF